MRSFNCSNKERKTVMLWEVDILPKDDPLATEIADEAAELGIGDGIEVRAARGYLLEGRLTKEDAMRIGIDLLADPVVERVRVGAVNDPALLGQHETSRLIHVLPKRGVTDAVAESALRALGDMEITVSVSGVRTLRKYWVDGLADEQVQRLCDKVLASDSVEQVVLGPLQLTELDATINYEFQQVMVPIRDLDDDRLSRVSREGILSLSLEEMKTIQAHFAAVDRDPTDVELETIAQTWSEHCSHKTLKGRIHYEDENGTRQFQNMLKETVFDATMQIRRTLGDDDWCVSVFEDNAGIVKFDDDYHLAFKVETHNRPSAIEPYGGANTGVGGVIRDTLGTGLGATPICNTDVFCFAPPNTPLDEIPTGVLNPRRVFRGVVAGAGDYGNRMGIPTVNGAIYFDQRYLGNPLVFCGNVGKIPVNRVSKRPLTGDLIVVMGGRTGRDGIHGATFSSAELTSQSDEASGGAVQIGNAITEKMVQDVLLAARDRGLFHAVTDCGAGGLSSAVGEMGQRLGAEVQLEQVPLKYQGLTYTEIWISEAQERMVLAVPGGSWDELSALCKSEGVEVTAIGTFTDTGRLVLTYDRHQVCDLDMSFLHDGRPPVVRKAVYQASVLPCISKGAEMRGRESGDAQAIDPTALLHQILSALNVASKEWVIRQYDHEVQGGSVIKPLVGAANDGPGDAAVMRPRLDSWRGVAVSCGMNPHYGDWDTYHMAASAIDEAVRNCVAVGADPSRIAILDNFCWGNTDRPETLGSLVRAALACRDMAIAFGTPFISGKDSLNNEFSYQDSDGNRQTISIPATLLISAIGQVPDVRQCVTMDLKQSGNVLYVIGTTKNELAGSHLSVVQEGAYTNVPQVHPRSARNTFVAVHQAIRNGLVRACHDLSEGGLSVGLAEMAFAGNLGAQIDLQSVPHAIDGLATAERLTALLFAESNSRFLCEIPAERGQEFEAIMSEAEVVFGALGRVIDTPQLKICDGRKEIINERCVKLKESWQSPLRW
jgi:phosphoribosylformylglycinamidine synthase II